MAIPEPVRFVLVAIAAMIVFRFVNELSVDMQKTEDSVETATGAPSDAAAPGPTKPFADKAVGSSGKKAVSDDQRRHKLRKNQVLIEYCTS